MTELLKLAGDTGPDEYGGIRRCSGSERICERLRPTTYHLEERRRAMAVDEQEIRSGTVEELAETVSDAEKREAVHNVRSAGDALFTWDYESSRARR